MLFKAMSLNGEPLKFTLGDCPIHIGGNKGALAGVVGSKLFIRDTIVRGYALEDGTEVYEGDFIIDKSSNKEIGIVVYNAGFYIHTKDGVEKKVPEARHILVKQGSIESVDIVCYEMLRSPIEFKYNDSVFHLENFVCKKNGIIVLSNISTPVSEQFIRVFTGLEVGGEKLFYGDFFDCGTVELIDGVPKLRDLSSNEVVPLA